MITVNLFRLNPDGSINNLREWGIKEITLHPSEYKVISKVKPKTPPPYLDI